MKIGLGLYRHMLTRDYYDFARQAGCTHVVVHLVDYFNQGVSNPRNNQPSGGKYEPWGLAGEVVVIAGQHVAIKPQADFHRRLPIPPP